MIVLVADPDPQVRAGLSAQVRELVPEAEVVEACGATDAEAQALSGRAFDLALVGYLLPDGWGPRVADTLTAAGALAVVVSDVRGLSPGTAARVVRRADVATMLPLWLDTAVRQRAAGAPPRPARAHVLARLAQALLGGPAERRVTGPLPRLR